MGAERQNGKGKYRHVSHADFHKSQEMGNKMRKITSEADGNAAEDSHNLLTTDQDPSMRTPGLTTVQRYQRVKAKHELRM